MKFGHKRFFATLAAFFFLLAGVAHGGVGTHGSGRFYGEITDFASIFVNGVEYDISAANIIINGIPNQSESQLKRGMAVRVEGTVHVGGLTGTATVVEYLGDIEGKVDAAPVITATGGSFTMHGIVIKTDRRTKYENVAGLASIAAGNTVEVSGFFNANDGSFSATLIEKKPVFDKIELRGFVSNLNTANTTFRLGPTLIVNYSAAELRDVPVSGLANGLFVNVKADFAPISGVLQSTRIHGESSVLRSISEPLGIVQGVAANVTASGLVMGNQPIVINGTTIFDGAPISALTNGAKAIATGPVVAGVMTAAAITIAPDVTSVESRKTHGAAGMFPLPIATNIEPNGAITVEPRAAGGAHTLVFTFNGPITSIGGVTSKNAAGTADVGVVSYSFAGDTVTVQLSNVPDASRAKITITNINLLGVDAVVSVGFMSGDVTGSRTVDAGDISTVKARAGQTLTASNFLADVNLSGAIDGNDVSVVKSHSGSMLP